MKSRARCGLNLCVRTYERHVFTLRRETYKLPQQISVLELPHRRLQPVNRDGVAVSHVGNASIAVSGGTEREESFAVRVHVGTAIKPPDGDTINDR